MATFSAESMKGRARFAAACGVLSQYVKAVAMEQAVARPAAATVALPLMPGADLSMTTTTTTQEEQLTIFYGGRVLVLDDVPADKAAGLLQLAAAAVDMPAVARKASLQRFMEKRRGRAAARATPYSRPEADDACADGLTLKL